MSQPRADVGYGEPMFIRTLLRYQMLLSGDAFSLMEYGSLSVLLSNGSRSRSPPGDSDGDFRCLVLFCLQVFHSIRLARVAEDDAFCTMTSLKVREATKTQFENIARGVCEPDAVDDAIEPCKPRLCVVSVPCL
jgi:hypothetical protein